MSQRPWLALANAFVVTPATVPDRMHDSIDLAKHPLLEWLTKVSLVLWH